jgi:hypothetical protein
LPLSYRVITSWQQEQYPAQVCSFFTTTLKGTAFKFYCRDRGVAEAASQINDSLMTTETGSGIGFVVFLPLYSSQ